MSKAMIVKVQLSVASTDGVRRVLIYDRSRRFQYEGGVDDENLIKAMAGRPKAYFEASLGGGSGLELGDEVEAQPW